jgi:peptidyl-dipeptidase A
MRALSSFGAIALAALALACGSGAANAPAGSSPSPTLSPSEVTVDQARAFLERYNADFERLEGALTAAYWKASNSGAEADFADFAAADLALRTYHSDGARYAELKALLATRGAQDPLSARSLELAELAYRGNQLPPELLADMVRRSTAIEQIFNTYRVKLGDAEFSNNDLLERLRGEKDSAAREAIWKGLKDVGGVVGPDLVALAKVRNTAARAIGYPNFWEMQIRLQEHDPALVLALFAELEQRTDAPFRAMKAELDAEIGARLGLCPAELKPWHYDNPFFQAPPPSAAVDPDIFYDARAKEDLVERALRFYADIGLPMDDLAARSDFYERPGKDQHAFCISMNRADDVRMLLNIKPTQEWMDTMLHESGHAIYSKYIDRDLPFNVRDSAHILTTEGIAMLFGALAKNPTWLVGYAGADPRLAAEKTPALLEQRRREQLIFARWAMVMLHFERALYEDPDQDLDALWYTTVARFQLLTPPTDRAGRNDWAAKPHFTMAPVYYHNYLLGELFGAQLRAMLAGLAKHQGPASSLSFNGRKDFGAALIEKVFRPGMREPWPAFVEHATGHPLSAEAFAREVTK